MKKVQQVVFTAATLVALSGLAYSANTGSSSTSDPAETSTSSDSGTSSPAEDSATGTSTDKDMESTPGTGGDIEKGDYPSGSPGGIMGRYSSAKKGGHRMYPAGEHEETNP